MYTLIIDFETEQDRSSVVNKLADMADENEIKKAFQVKSLTELEAMVITAKLGRTMKLGRP